MLTLKGNQSIVWFKNLVFHMAETKISLILSEKLIA